LRSNRLPWIVLLAISLTLCCFCAVTVTIAGSAIYRSVDWRDLRWSDIEALGTGTEVTDRSAQSVSVAGPVTLVVDVPVGNITVKADASDQVALLAIKRAWGWNRSQAEMVLDAITVDFEGAGDHVRLNAGGLKTVEDAPRSPQVDIELSVPEETTVQLDSNVGRILIAGTHGDVYIMADVGEVALQDVVPSGNLQVETQVAAIELAGHLADRATYRLTSDIGRITLGLPPDSTFSIDARSDIGSVGVEFPLAGRRSTWGFVGEEARGDVGANPTAELYLRCRVGNISVHPKR
jgi:hypothetical protein